MPTPNSVYSLCKCGCGCPTRLATKTSIRDKTTKGIPVSYLPGHQFKTFKIDFSDAAPFKINGEYCKLIDLAGGWFAIVSADVHRRLAQHSWTKIWRHNTGSYYAFRHDETHLKRIGIAMHREILGLMQGDRRRGDHINGETLDNRTCNLRYATIAENNRNAKRNKRNTSGYKGVNFRKGKNMWRARISFDRKRIQLGYFPTPQLAHDAYKAAAAHYHGDYARMN